MTRTHRAQASFLSLLALLNACGGRTTEHDGIDGTEPTMHAGGAPATGAAGGSDTGSASPSSSTGSAVNRTNNAGSNGTGRGPAGGGTTIGAGGSANGNGGTGGSGGTVGDAGGVTNGPGSASERPKVQVWVGALQEPITQYRDGLRPDLPQHVVLALNPEGAEDVGSMILGDAPPPPPPTDPNAFYPPGPSGYLDVDTYLGFLVEGVAYSLRDVRRTDTRLTFHLNPAELWKDWCILRTECSVTLPAPGAGSPNPDYLCTNNPQGFGVCSCEDAKCRWNTEDPSVWTIDLELRDGVLEGLVAQGEEVEGGPWTRGIRLKRVE